MRRFLPSCALLIGLLQSPASRADEIPPPSADVRATFVNEAVAKYGLAADEIEHWLAQARYQPSIVAAMSRPAEGVKAWKDYRPIFLGDRRIRQGRDFLREHADALRQVSERSGVPAEIIVAIIGVETHYGQITGRYRVLDALYTLGFYYPASGLAEKRDYEARRAQFFRNELAQLLLLADENGLDLATLTGSYAGAMGWGQFMPSSYRAYAKDGDGDGRIDLFADTDDIFASVANYFAAHGWQRDEPVAVPALVDPGANPPPPGKLEASHSLAELGRLGFRPQVALGEDRPANLVVLEGERGTEHWLGFDNFYVITRYNVSPMYAMAVYQLSQELGAAAPTPVAALTP